MKTSSFSSQSLIIKTSAAMSMLHNYFIIIFRSIRKSRIYSLMNIFGLALSLAAVIIVTLYIYTEFSSDSQHEKANSIYRVGYHSLQPITVRTAMSSAPIGPALKRDYADILDFVRVSNPMWITDGLLMSYDNKSAQERGVLFVDTNFFEFFDYEFIHGTPGNALSEPNKIVLTEQKSNFFFGDANPLGQVLHVGDGHLMQVGAVIRPSEKPTHMRFHYLMPIDAMNGYLESVYGSLDRFESHNFNTYILVNEEFNPDDFNRNRLEEFFLRYSTRNYVAGDVLESVRFDFKPLRAIYFDNDAFGDLYNPDSVSNKGNKTHLLVFGLMVIFLIAIAAINYTNIAIARSLKRSKEVGVRKVLGSLKRQLVLQHISEAAVFVMLALILALFIAEFLIPGFNATMNKSLSLSSLTEKKMLISLVGIVFLLIIASGSYPAFYMSSIAPIDAIKARFTMSRGVLGLRSLLLGFQFFVAIFIIIVTVFVYTQFNYMNQKNPGFAIRNRVNVMLPTNDRITPEWISSFKASLLQNADIKKVSSAIINPLPGNLVSRWSFPVDGDDGAENVTLYVASVDPDYFDVFDIGQTEGRLFSWNSPGDFTNGVLFNEKAVRVFGWENAVGKTFNRSGESYHVLGIVSDFHFQPFHQPVEPLMLRATRSGRDISMVLNHDNVPGGLAALESTWQEFLPEYPIKYRFIEEMVSDTISDEKASAALLAVIAAFAVFISIFGLFGLAGYTTMQRSRELAVRRTFGAETSNIIWLLSNNYFKILGFAFLPAGILSFLYINRWLDSFAYRISIMPWPFMAAALAAVSVTLITITYHVLKSSTSNPINALQNP